MPETKHILVTGAAGFIGRHLCAALRSRGFAVRAVDKAPGHDGVKLNLARTGPAREAVKGVDAVVHLAAMTGVAQSFDQPTLCRQDTADSTLNLLAGALEYGAARFVFVSSAAVYGDQAEGPLHEDAELRPASPYAAAKIEAEEHVWSFAERGINGVSLRCFNVYGPGARGGSGCVGAFAAALREGRPMVLHGDGGQERDFIHVSDVVRASLAALDHDGELAGMALNVGTGRGVTIRRLGEMMAKLAGVEPEFAQADKRPGDVRHSCADIARAREVLGFEARVKLEDGLREVLHG